MVELIRVRVLSPGDVVTVHPSFGAYTELPDGLKEGDRVTVAEVDIGYATVVNEAGRTFEVAFPQVEMPRSIWWKGDWIDRMTHPEGERACAWACAGA